MGTRSGITKSGYDPRIAAMRQSIQSWQIIRAKMAANEREYRFRFGDLLDDLKRLDPTGWEAWYDSAAIPEMLYWDRRIEPVLDVMLCRVNEIRASKGLPQFDVSIFQPL